MTELPEGVTVEKVLDIRDRVVVIKGPRQTLADQDEISQALCEKGASLVIFMDPGHTITAVDEAEMAEHDWFHLPVSPPAELIDAMRAAYHASKPEWDEQQRASMHTGHKEAYTALRAFFISGGSDA